MQEMEWLPIDEVEVEYEADIPLIRNATGTPFSLRTGNLSGKADYTLIAISSERELSVYVHNCVIDDFSILKFIKKFLLLMKWVFYEFIYHMF